MFLFQLKIMPPKRGRKKRVIPKKEEAKLNVNEESVVIDDESGDERLRLAIEESKKIQSKEDDDLKWLQSLITKQSLLVTNSYIWHRQNVSLINHHDPFHSYF